MILCCCSKYFFARRWSMSQPPMSTQNSTRCDSNKSSKKLCIFSLEVPEEIQDYGDPRNVMTLTKVELSSLITARANSQLILRSNSLQGHGRWSRKLFDWLTDWKEAKHLHLHQGEMIVPYFMIMTLWMWCGICQLYNKQ